MTDRERGYFDKVVGKMTEADCVCLEPSYRPSKEVWWFVCSCGEIGYQRPSDFYRGRRCQSCGLERLRESRRSSDEEVKKMFEGSPEVYIDSWLGEGRTYVKYLCSEGHEITQVLYSFKAGHRCMKCSTEESRRRYQLSIEEVSRELKEMGMEFIDTEYINMDKPFKYRCSCGRESVGYLSALRKGFRCGCLIPRGESSPMWNPNLTEEDRIKGRNYLEYDEWYKSVYRRDDYTCQRCGSRGGRLHAHHIYSYSRYPELRTEIDNGITLCRTCHINFHWEYGYKEATPEDFYVYMDW